MPSIAYVKFDGTSLHPSRPVDAAVLSKLVIGKPYKASITKPRNRKVHNLYFAAIAAAAKHWPEGREPEPEGDEDLLRAWLQCKANWCHRIGPFQPHEMDYVLQLIQLVRANDKYAFVRTTDIDGDPGLIVFVPQSVEYERADDPTFEPVKRVAFEIIETTLGCTVKELVEANDQET